MAVLLFRMSNPLRDSLICFVSTNARRGERIKANFGTLDCEVVSVMADVLNWQDPADKCFFALGGLLRDQGRVRRSPRVIILPPEREMYPPPRKCVEAETMNNARVAVFSDGRLTEPGALEMISTLILSASLGSKECVSTLVNDPPGKMSS